MKTRRMVVIGHGMVSQRFLEALRANGVEHGWRILVIGEERHAAYDRVALSSYVDGRTAAELSVVPPDFSTPSASRCRWATVSSRRSCPQVRALRVGHRAPL